MTATGIPLRHLHLVWPDLWPLLEPAVKRSPDKPDVLARLLFHDAQLWAVYDGDSARGRDRDADSDRQPFECAERGRRCLIWLVGGSRLREWAADFIAKLEDWARSLGCVTLRGVGRPGWARIVKKFGGVSVDAVDGLPAWERRIA